MSILEISPKQGWGKVNSDCFILENQSPKEGGVGNSYLWLWFNNISFPGLLKPCVVQQQLPVTVECVDGNQKGIEYGQRIENTTGNIHFCLLIFVWLSQLAEARSFTLDCEWPGCRHGVTGPVLRVREFTRVISFIVWPHVINEQVCSVRLVLWFLKSFAVLQQRPEKHPISLLLRFSLSAPSPQMSNFYLKPLNRRCPIIVGDCWTSYLGVLFWSAYCFVHQMFGNAAACCLSMYGNIHEFSHIKVGATERRQALKSVTCYHEIA